MFLIKLWIYLKHWFYGIDPVFIITDEELLNEQSNNYGKEDLVKEILKRKGAPTITYGYCGIQMLDMENYIWICYQCLHRGERHYIIKSRARGCFWGLFDCIWHKGGKK